LYYNFYDYLTAEFQPSGEYHLSRDEEKFVDELFTKLRGPNPAKEINDAIQKLKQGQGDVNQVLNAITRYSSELEAKDQYRKAAFQYYTGVRIIHEFYDDKEVEKQWLLKVSECMIKASGEYTTWDDIDGGAACIAIAAILRMLAGYWEIPQFMTEFNEKFQDKIPNGKYAAGIIYIPFDIMNGIKEINAELIQRAESYTETYLFSHKDGQLFKDSIRDVLNMARTKMMDQIKLPRIQAEVTFPPDIVYGEEFPAKVRIVNEGEGDAGEVTSKVDIPKDINIVSGETKMSFPSLKTGEQHEFNYKFVCPTGEGSFETKHEIRINVSYKDLLGNSRSTQLGPFELTIRQFRKADELNIELEKLITSSEEVVSLLKECASNETASSALDFWNSMFNSCKEQISNGEFALAELNIKNAGTFINNIGKTAALAIKSQLEDSEILKESLKTMVEELTNASNNANKIKANFEKALTP